jgi:SAM-dependent methyltransferase
MDLRVVSTLLGISEEHRHRLRQRLRRLSRPALLGTLRRTTPLSDGWGFDRGIPVDRYYIERFLNEHRQDIHGRVLEVKDSTYTNRYGTGVEHAEVLDINPANPHATIVADLAVAETIPSETFDCFILTQTLHLIYDIRSAVRHARRLLRPEGVLLASMPAVSRVSRGAGLGGDFWRFTVASCAALFGEIFGPEQVTIRSYGNVLTAIAFLTGMAYEELSCQELEVHDEYFPVIIAAVGIKR